MVASSTDHQPRSFSRRDRHVLLITGGFSHTARGPTLNLRRCILLLLWKYSSQGVRGAQPQADDSVKAPMRPHHPNLGRYPQGLPYLVRNDQTNDDKHARSTTKLGEKSRRRRATVTQTTRVIPFPAKEPRIRFRPPVFPIGHFTLVRRD